LFQTAGYLEGGSRAISLRSIGQRFDQSANGSMNIALARTNGV
jgi:hypothetical protein